jgi:uncharacterized membrane protein
MYQSRPEAMTPARDDVWSTGSSNGHKANVGPVERALSILAGATLSFSGLRRVSVARLLAGGALIYRGVTGFCPCYRAIESRSGVSLLNGLQIEQSVTVNKPVHQVYSLWRRLENLPRFMSHIESVTPAGDNRSHWVAKLAPPFRLEWDAEIVDDEENKKLSWRSLSSSSIDHTGTVFFHAAPAGRGTEIKILLTYVPPGGSAGAAAAELVRRITRNQIRSDLRTFKAVAETGEKPTGAIHYSARAPQRLAETEQQRAHANS